MERLEGRVDFRPSDLPGVLLFQIFSSSNEPLSCPHVLLLKGTGVYLRGVFWLNALAV